MKILISTGIYPPDIGGPATYAKLIFDELPKFGIDISVLSFGEVRKYPKLIRHIFYIFKLLNKTKGVDLILAQDTVSVGMPSLIVAKLMRKKFFVRVPGDYAWEQSVQRYGVKDSIDDFQNIKYSIKVEILRRIQKLTVNGADTIITPSIYFKNLVSKWVKKPGKVFCIYNGVQLNDLYTRNNNFEPRTLISAGRLVPWKGFYMLIKMIKNLPEWKLKIAGDGPIKDSLIKYAKVEGVLDRVTFLGQIKREELIKILKKSELFVLNTSFESFSFQVVEAMAAGVPVITTNIGNLSEIIENNISGILIEPDDEEAMIKAINKLASDEKFKNNMIEEAKNKSKMFSIENTLDSLLKLIKM